MADELEGKEPKGTPEPTTDDQVKVESTPSKIMFNGREYASLAEAEANYKELQTAYQKTKAEKEQLEQAKAEVIEDDEIDKLFSATAPVAPISPYAPAMDEYTKGLDARQAAVERQVAFLAAEKDTTNKPYFNDVKAEVAKLIQTDPELQALTAVHRSEKAVDYAYAKALAKRLDTLKKAEYNRGMEEALRDKAKPTTLVSGDTPVTPPKPKKEISEMTLEELEAFLPHKE